MIERLSTDVPTQPRTATNEGERRINPVKVLENRPATDFSGKNQQAQYHDPNRKQKVEEVVKGLNNFLEPAHTSMRFKLHEKLNEYYVTIVNDNTDEVIKEIPSKKLLDTYAAMAEHLGLLVDKKI